ncbi:FtsK/SpoIIIE domain-containing protein [Anaeromicrobium sediminis]|nr:FtsK/SpoIIIE domain-containing protein [Anaeromicrobium sediminis]
MGRTKNMFDLIQGTTNEKDKFKNSLLTTGLSSISLAFLFKALGTLPLGVNTIPYQIALMIGGATSIGTHYYHTDKKWDTLFNNCNLKKGEMLPQLREKKKTKYGYCLRFSLPLGLSENDFQKNKKAIEQYLDRRVNIKYKHKNIIIEVIEKELESFDYEVVKCDGNIEFPVGYKYNNKIVKVDLSYGSPHMLIAGETGSGKSTTLRGILTNLMLTKNRSQLKLHLIDLKNGAEFNIFKNCKLVDSFSRNKTQSYKVLEKMSAEVYRRYDLFFQNNVVDIKEYNQKFKKKRLDYQVIIIDEFADLSGEKDSIEILISLAQKARACGIHLIVATQRPSATIITGDLKANIPVVLGLKTMNEVNSRIIIDHSGLESLKGKGHGILRYNGQEIELQSMYLGAQKARNLIKHTYRKENKGIDKNFVRTVNKRDIGEVESFEFFSQLGGK